MFEEIYRFVITIFVTIPSVKAVDQCYFCYNDCQNKTVTQTCQGENNYCLYVKDEAGEKRLCLDANIAENICSLILAHTKNTCWYCKENLCNGIDDYIILSCLIASIIVFGILLGCFMWKRIFHLELYIRMNNN